MSKSGERRLPGPAQAADGYVDGEEQEGDQGEEGREGVPALAADRGGGAAGIGGEGVRRLAQQTAAGLVRQAGEQRLVRAGGRARGGRWAAQGPPLCSPRRP